MDVAEKRPATGKKSTNKTATAAAKGANGHALGVIFVRDAENKAASEEKERESMKDRLRKLCALDRDSHLEFRKVIEDRVDSIKRMAEMAGKSLSEWLSLDGKSASIYATLSMWSKMSKAAEAGYKPNYELPWSVISVGATDALAAKANTGTGGTRTAGPTARKGRPQKSNLDKAIGYLTPMPLQDLEAIHAWLGKHIANVRNPQVTGSRVAKTRAATKVATPVPAQSSTARPGQQAAMEAAEHDRRTAANEALAKAMANPGEKK